jgi:4-hydroxyproline epimerase
MTVRRVRVIDTHTGGEPTRVVVDGGPDLGAGGMAERRAVFRREFDEFRSAVVNEPRGSDVMVGALVCEPSDPDCVAGVLFFNNVGTLGMCGHGTLGVAVALAYQGRIAPGVHRFETPVGAVTVTLEDAHHAAIDNVASYRAAQDVGIEVPGLGRFVGDVAWGGNWFFLVKEHGEDLDLANVERLTEVTWRIRRALDAAGIRGDDGGEIDHIELYGPPTVPGAHSRNFVLCPGKAYDRSPCGTGTSAKVACLVADGTLRAGEVWRQESIVGSIFEASARIVDGRIYPRLRGSAYVNAESTLIFDPEDPFAMGIRP